MAAPKKTPAGSGRTRTPTLDIERVVIDAATRLLSTVGPQELTIRRIATEADVAPMTLYNRFGSKQGIVDLLFIDGFRALDNALNIAESSDVVTDMIVSARAYRTFALENPTRYALMFLRAVPDYEPSEEAGRVASQSFLRLMQTVSRHQESGAIGGADAIEIAQRVWSSMHGAVALELLGIGFVADQATHIDNLARTIGNGLIAEPRHAASPEPPPKPKTAPPKTPGTPPSHQPTSHQPTSHQPTSHRPTKTRTT
jgi:AcrR family transcriptional regulator